MMDACYRATIQPTGAVIVSSFCNVNATVEPLCIDDGGLALQDDLTSPTGALTPPKARMNVCRGGYTIPHPLICRQRSTDPPDAAQ